MSEKPEDRKVIDIFSKESLSEEEIERRAMVGGLMDEVGSVAENLGPSEPENF